MDTKIVLVAFVIGAMFVTLGCVSNPQTMGQDVNYPTQEQTGYPNMTSFAKCITEHGAVMYGASWCSHCNHQKQMFGDGVEYINFVDCDVYKDKCEDAGIKGYPTWVIDGKQYLGVQPLSRL